MLRVFNRPKSLSDDAALEVASLRATALPAAYTYCDAGSCTPVKSEGPCGASWAYATTGVFEQLLKRAGTSQVLSERHLMFCNTESPGCPGSALNGGIPYYFDTPDLTSLIGAVYESEFPGTATACVAVPHHERLTGWGLVVPSGTPSTDTLKNALYTYGPLWVTVCIDAAFQSYMSGVFAGTTSCGPPNHAVVLLGWDDSTQTFLLRNSWGAGWGEDGYMRINYGANSIGENAIYLQYGSCTRNCTGKQCGPDGCDGTCGSCIAPQICDPSGQCVACQPDCAGKQCGPDGCGGSCGSCREGCTCGASGVCQGSCFAHSPCLAGEALPKTTSACVSTLCTNYLPYCCTVTWDSLCVVYARALGCSC